jgi:hypothetical protein
MKALSTSGKFYGSINLPQLLFTKEGKTFPPLEKGGQREICKTGER